MNGVGNENWKDGGIEGENKYIDRQLQLGAFLGLCKNLVQWKFPGIYKGGFREDS